MSTKSTTSESETASEISPESARKAGVRQSQPANRHERTARGLRLDLEARRAVVRRFMTARYSA
jgi:hypothetical protein